MTRHQSPGRENFATITVPKELHAEVSELRELIATKGDGVLPPELRAAWARAQRRADRGAKPYVGMGMVIDVLMASFKAHYKWANASTSLVVQAQAPVVPNDDSGEVLDRVEFVPDVGIIDSQIRRGGAFALDQHDAVTRPVRPVSSVEAAHVVKSTVDDLPANPTAEQLDEYIDRLAVEQASRPPKPPSERKKR